MKTQRRAKDFTANQAIVLIGCGANLWLSSPGAAVLATAAGTEAKNGKFGAAHAGSTSAYREQLT
jgi:hypothetical protein